MKDSEERKEQLLREVKNLRKRIQELELSTVELDRSIASLKELEEQYKKICSAIHDEHILRNNRLRARVGNFQFYNRCGWVTFG